MRLIQERVLDIIADYELSTRTFADTWIAAHEADPCIQDLFEEFAIEHISRLARNYEIRTCIPKDEINERAQESMDQVQETAKKAHDLGLDTGLVAEVGNYLRMLAVLGDFPVAWDRFVEELDAEIDMRQC